MPLEGLHLGPYRLLRLLGSGGMGEVYLAEDARIDQQVAIKVIRSEGLASPGGDVPKEAVRLFEREAKAIARLDHPNILPLYAYGEEMLNDTRLTYLVMPYRKEGTLATWLRQRGGSQLLSPAEVAPLLQQAADALQHAHDQQIIHQDVKPTNFLIRLRSDRPRRPDLLLADFGIAKLTSATASTSQSIRGTPIYMAPEQWDGHPVPATDQYALAIMIYELLVGRPPFRGGPGQVMHQHYMTPPPAPSTLNPGLSAAIDDVLLRSLAKHPEERFPSVSAFARVFRQAVQSGGELQTAEEASRTAVRSETPPLLEPTSSPAQESRAAPTVAPANATSLPTELATPARQTPFPTGLARSTTPPAGRSEVTLPAKPAQRGTSRRLVLGGLAILVVVALVGGIAWFRLPHTPSARDTQPSPTGVIHPSPAGVITEFPIPTPRSSSQAITAGPDGNFWFTESAGNKIGRISTNGSITEFSIPTPGSGPAGIAAGPDGNLWFTEYDGNKIGRISTGGSITEFPLTSGSTPVAITAGPDGNLWFTEFGGNKIGRISTSGSITEFPIPGNLDGITVGPDGNLWFTVFADNLIGHISTTGSIAEFPIPTFKSAPYAITAGPDGNLWFTEDDGDKIGRISTSGSITEFRIPTSGSNPFEIILGPDGNLWFTEGNGDKIGRISTSGSITEFPLTSGSSPIGITTGPDGSLWFTESGSDKIGRITTGK